MFKELLKKIGLNPEKPLSFNQAKNVLEEAKTQDFKKEAAKKDKPISNVDPLKVKYDLQNIIEHFIPNFGRWKQVKTLMRLRMNGASIERIAFAFNVPKQTVADLENMGKDKIIKGIEKEPAYRVKQKDANPKTRLIYPVS